MTFAPTAPDDLDLRLVLEQDGPERAARRLLALHPVEIAEALEALDAEDRFDVVRYLPNQATARVLMHADAAFREGLLARLPPEGVAALLERLPMDDAAALIDQLPEEKAEAVRAYLPEEERDQLQSLRDYPPQSVGRLMVRRIPRLLPFLTAGETLERLRQVNAELETMNDVYIVDERGRLVGVTGLRELVLADPARPLRELMQTRLVMVTPETDREVAANLISRYNFLALPVVDGNTRLLGIVTVDDLIDVLIQEGTEDVLRMGGVGGHEDAMESTPYWAGRITAVVKKRITWLALLFVAETLTGSVLRHFQGELERVVALSFFVPLLIGTGGNAGSQTVMTVVRGLALGEIRLADTLRVLWREMTTGVLLGLLLGVVAFSRALLWGAKLPLAFTVAITIVAVCTWANTVGSLVPLVAQRLRIDPTVVSAPFITTLVDATGLVIYFVIAKMLLGL
jgi:magnesium transporter